MSNYFGEIDRIYKEGQKFLFDTICDIRDKETKEVDLEILFHRILGNDIALLSMVLYAFGPHEKKENIRNFLIAFCEYYLLRIDGKTPSQIKELIKKGCQCEKCQKKSNTSD